MDLALSEEVTFPGEVTKYPVESGADFTDHIRDLPPMITLECIVSDTPVGVVATERNDAAQAFEEGEPVPLPSVEALARLRDMKERRKPVTVETTIGVFDNMACTEIVVTSDKDKSLGTDKRPGALFFTAKFEHVVITTNARTVVKVKMPTGSKLKVENGIIMPVDGIILWRHGDPPGSLNIVSITRVKVSYSQSGEITAEEAVAAGLVLPAAPFVTYFDIEDGGKEVTGAKRKALEDDIIRDLDNGTANFYGAPHAFKPDKNLKPSSLPAGISMDRFKLPDNATNTAPGLENVGFLGVGA